MNPVIRGVLALTALLVLGLPGAPTACTAEPAAPRQYAPSREVNLLHLALDVTPDFRQRSLAGQATLRFKPIALPLTELRLDAVDLQVTNLTSTAKVLGWQTTQDKIIVTFDPPLPPEQEVSVTVAYQAHPAGGLYFRTREQGYPEQDEHLWTQGEAISARYWYPSIDSPNAKFTSEVTCRVPEGMVVLSNGRKVSEEKSGGLVAVRWLQDKPHANYLVALVAGHFKKLEDRHRETPLAFWTLPTDFPQAASSFDGTARMVEFFERETGVPYPWARYDQVCVADFVVGGMENTTLTVLNNDTLFTPATENLQSSQGLVAHELAHQWFGNLVTCKDWSEIWLNEGFATYYEHLYDEHKNGRDEFLYRMWLGGISIAEQRNDPRPLVSRDFKDPDEMFDWRSYGKGAWVLHMLRSQLGPDLFRRCIQTYLERHRYGNVVTEDLNTVIEELSGRSFDQFFDQWVYHPGVPQLEVDYAWDERSKMARLTIRQAQPTSDKALLFRLPLTVRFKSQAGLADRPVVVKEKSEDFYFPLSQAPERVRVDPELAVLGRVTFRLPGPLLDAQLADDADALGRIIAIDQLRSRKDGETVARLKRLLNNDRFYGVRLEASSALRGIHTSEALDALLASARQGDARVRRAVVADIGRFYQEEALAGLLRVLKEEKNPDIQAEVVQALAAYGRPEAREAILENLRAASYQDRLAGAAIRAIRAQQDPASYEPLLEVLQRRDKNLHRHALAAGLDALAWLGRSQSNRTAALEFLTRHLTDPRPSIQLAALAALGTLEEPRALPALGTFASAAKESPERKAAEKAMDAIRAGKKPAVELGELRNEMLELQKQNRELKRQFETLQKQFEAAGAVKSNTPPRPPRKAR
jgi:aminopeptidase N